MQDAAHRLSVALVQMAMEADPETNTKRALDFVARAASGGAHLVCLPELYRTPYFCAREDAANFDLAEPIPGPSTEAFSRLAREKAISIIVPIFERRTRGLYHNALVVLGPDGQIQGHYRKMHIPDDPNFYEKFYFAPGDLGFAPVATAHATIGPLICWDQWYPEAARILALEGAEVLVYPTAIGFSEADRAHWMTQRDAWETIQRSHAIANGVFVLAVNRCGVEGGLTFWGSSFIADPFGRVLAKAAVDKEEILRYTLDLSAIDATRHGWPFLRDRRIDAYSDIVRRFGSGPRRDAHDTRRT
ncbi:MAG: carbon-nitrogen hydrolase [Thermoplasmatota archaeon]